MFDVIMPVTSQHNNIACLSIISLARHVAPHHIYVITPRENFPFFKSMQDDLRVTLLDENCLIPEIDLRSIGDFIEKAGEKRSRAGWYFQQFLKMAACFLPDMSEHYLVWDADTVMLKPIQFINDQNQVLVKPSSEYHQPYFDTYQRIFGKTRSVDYSFISEHFMIKTQYMNELIAAIESRTNSKRHWVWEIMEAVETKHLSGAGFSEYETYGNFVHTVHPGALAVRPLPTIRYGARKFGLIPNQYDLYRLSRSCAYASFESWDAGNPLRRRIEKSLSFFIYVLTSRKDQRN